MATIDSTIRQLAERQYKWGFHSQIDSESVPPGLSEEIVRLISEKKNEPDWLLQWRLKALAHWRTMEEPEWSNVYYPPIDYQQIIYYSAPKSQSDGPKSLDDVDPSVREMFEKLGIPLSEQERLAGVAVDAVVDSVSVATTFKEKLAEMGVIFCSFSEPCSRTPSWFRSTWARSCRTRTISSPR